MSALIPVLLRFFSFPFDRYFFREKGRDGDYENGKGYVNGNEGWETKDWFFSKDEQSINACNAPARWLRNRTMSSLAPLVLFGRACSSSHFLKLRII